MSQAEAALSSLGAKLPLRCTLCNSERLSVRRLIWTVPRSTPHVVALDAPPKFYPPPPVLIGCDACGKEYQVGSEQS